MMTQKPLAYIERKGTDNGPVLILLHGFGSNEQDMFGFVPLLDERIHIISVRAPVSIPGNDFAWFELNLTLDDKITYEPAHVMEAQRALVDFIAFIGQKLAVAPQRIYLLGFSQGALMSALLALTAPEQIGGAIMLSGWVPPEALPHLASEEARGRLNVFVGHGLYDDVVPIEQGRAADQLLTSLHVPHIYREYPVGHQIHDECLDDVLIWLDQIAGPSA